METAERIVEAYVRHVKKWATVPNVKYRVPRSWADLDLLAVNPADGYRFHIEVVSSTSPDWQCIGLAEFERIANRVFCRQEAAEALHSYGFYPGQYKKVLVLPGYGRETSTAAQEQSIDLWPMKTVLNDTATFAAEHAEAFADDLVRMLQLLQCAGMLRINQDAEGL